MVSKLTTLDNINISRFSTYTVEIQICCRFFTRKYEQFASWIVWQVTCIFQNNFSEKVMLPSCYRVLSFKIRVINHRVRELENALEKAVILLVGIIENAKHDAVLRITCGIHAHPASVILRRLLLRFFFFIIELPLYFLFK